MCGILAIVDLKGRVLRQDVVTRLRDTMVHRGPDDQGMYLDGPVALAHRRLSVIDLSRAGHQPMGNEDGSLQLVFNGEIYNYLELREELRRHGHVFRSSTDSEVILHQYEEDGERCVEKFRGMFSFVLWDSKKQRLFAARDRLGIKPLYYYHDAQKLVLSSEIKAIIEDDEIQRRPDLTAIADYLYAGRALGSKTVFTGVSELEPGHHLSFERRSGAVRVTRYWDLSYNYDCRRTEDDIINELFSTVDEAVGLHCRSDAALGCHLSGGIDSSSIVGFAARHRGPVKTFSIKFSEDEHIDETRYAKAVATHVGAHYIEDSPTAADLADLLPFLIWQMDMPMPNDGAFGYFAVSELARRHVKVSLTGHGGDEVFAGYPAQFNTAYNTTDMFRRYADPDRLQQHSGLLRKVLRKGPRGLYRAAQSRLTRRRKTIEDTWVATHCGYEPKADPRLNAAFVRELRDYSPNDEYIRPFITAPTDQILDRCLYHDLVVYLPSLLTLEDRMSMAVSLESRVPLLDHRIVEFAATVPPAQKVRGLRPKHLLRSVSSRLLPHSVHENTVKRGFPVPGKFWRADRVRELIEEVLLSKECASRGIFDGRSLREMIRNSPNVTVFWSLVNLELWFRVFIDKDPFWLQKARNNRFALPQL